MLRKAARLRADEVRLVLKNGKTLRTENIVVKYIDAPQSKVAVVVSKKVAKNAPRRNAIRRTLYDSLPRPLPTGVMLVLLVQKNVPDFSADIKTICSKLFS